ncbi:MAG: serine/threonine protein kinase [Acidobacteriota bacterium]|nr:serine/threonine protein kinase [Acidobacteriota bacterium]
MATFERPTKIGKYEILATLGRGGMGVVYKARDPVIDRIVAIKTILVGEEVDDGDNLADRLTMEARSAGRLHHPNIVTVFDFGKEGDLSYIVMEYVEGINLGRVIDERRPLPLDTKLSLLVQIANGLAYAHERGVIHRDMKPANICIASPGTAKILDFGLARFDSTRLTKTGYMAGTIAYMSPERLGGTTGASDDIFALGAVAYELLTYQRAFPGATPPEVFGKILTPGPPPAPSQIADIPTALDPVILKALAKEAVARYATAAEFADELRHFVSTDVHRVMNDAPTMARPLAEFTTRPTGTAYGAPSIISEQETAIVADVTTKGASTSPDLDLTSGSTAATSVQPTPQARSRSVWIAVPVALLAIVIAAVIFWPRPAPVVKTLPPKPLPPTTAPVDRAAENTELQLANARSLSDELQRRELNAGESIDFSKAKGTLSVADQKLKEKDYQAGARLAADAIARLQAVIDRNDKRRHEAPPERPIKRVPNRQPGPAPQPPVIVASPLPPPRIEPAPAPVPVPVAPAPAPVRESLEREIGTFMQQLATAYQTRDVGFFRENSLQFNETLANAVRRSPSVRVELQVQRIDARDSQHASVSVKRTDWFPDASIAPATQSLIYHLDRSAGHWQIASIARP